MPRVRIANYSDFYDVRTGTEFHSVLDNRSGCFVGIAELTDEEAAPFLSRPSMFDLVTDEEFLEISTPMKMPTAPAPPVDTLASGDPLVDGVGALSETKGVGVKLSVMPDAPTPPGSK